MPRPKGSSCPASSRAFIPENSEPRGPAPQSEPGPRPCRWSEGSGDPRAAERTPRRAGARAGPCGRLPRGGAVDGAGRAGRPRAGSPGPCEQPPRAAGRQAEPAHPGFAARRPRGPGRGVQMLWASAAASVKQDSCCLR